MAGQGVIFHDQSGTAVYRTPKNEIWSGPYTFKDNTVCLAWKQVPNNPCSRSDKQGDTISIVNMATGQSRARIGRSADGNPEKLAP
jgi:hypothetical protein